MFLIEPEKSATIKVIRERCKKMDRSLKIKFWPSQVIVGNFSPKLGQKMPIIFEQNGNRKISVRLNLPSDPLVGYEGKDLGIALTQLEHLTVKDEEKDSPAVLTCAMKPNCADRMMKMLTGIQERVEKPFKDNKPLSRNITFILEPWPDSTPDTYCKVYYDEGEKTKEFHFDFEVGKQFLLKEIHAVWMQSLREQWSRRATSAVNHTHKLITEMDSHEWAQWLANQKLYRNMCPSGNLQFMSIEDNPIGRRDMRLNSFEYSQGVHAGIPMDKTNRQLFREEKKSARKMKIASRKLEAPVSVDSKKKDKEEEVSRVNGDYEPTFDETAWKRGIEERKMKGKKRSNQEGVQQTNGHASNHSTPIESQLPPQSMRLHQSPLQQQLESKRVKMHEEVVVTSHDVVLPPPLPTHSPAAPYIAPSIQYSPYPPPPMYQHPHPSTRQSIGYDGGGGYHYQYHQGTSHMGELVDGMRQMGNGDIPMYHHQQPLPPVQQYQYHHHPQMAYDYNPNYGVAAQNRPDLAMTDNEFLDSCGLTVDQGGSTSEYSTLTASFLSYQQPETKRIENASKEEEKVSEVAMAKNIRPQKPGEVRRGPDRITVETDLFIFPKKGHVLKDPAALEPLVIFIKDVKSLDRKDFVNDQVINFMLSYISIYMIKDMSRIVMYNTYFYTGLMKGINTSAFNQRKPIDPYWHNLLMTNVQRVIRWTKKFDPFARDYIVIPINEEYHWLLVTVFNPAGAIVDLTNEEESRKAPKCYIAFLDPLSGLDPCKRNHMTYAIKLYLAELYKATKVPPKGRFPCTHPATFDPERVIVERVLNTPVQNNFYDCGPYTLYYIEGLFCYPNTSITVHDFPNLDWREKFPECDAQADLMRDKIYNIMLSLTTPQARSRLERFERANQCGLSIEGADRRRRRHSAHPLGRMPHQHPAYRPRRYSLHPPEHGVIDTATFQLPREMVKMPATQMARALRIPEENFAIIY